MLKAYLHTKVKPSSRHWYVYDIEFDGDLVLTDSRDPTHDLARVLLPRGITGKVTIVDANTGMSRIIVDIEKAAKRYTDDTAMRFRPWKPFQKGELGRDVRPHSPEDELVVSLHPLSKARRAWEPAALRTPRLRNARYYRAGYASHGTKQ